MAITKLIPAGDLALTEDGTGFVWLDGGVEEVAQSLKTRFKFFLGEWFLNKAEGVPYYQHVLKKNPDIEVVRTVFRQVVLKTPGVLVIERFRMVYTPNTREIAPDFSLLVEGGRLVVKPEDRFFVITL